MATASVLQAKIGPMVRKWPNGQLEMQQILFSYELKVAQLQACNIFKAVSYGCVLSARFSFITTVCGLDEVVSVGHHLAITQGVTVEKVSIVASAIFTCCIC